MRLEDLPAPKYQPHRTSYKEAIVLRDKPRSMRERALHFLVRPITRLSQVTKTLLSGDVWAILALFGVRNRRVIRHPKRDYPVDSEGLFIVNKVPMALGPKIVEDPHNLTIDADVEPAEILFEGDPNITESSVIEELTRHNVPPDVSSSFPMGEKEDMQSVAFMETYIRLENEEREETNRKIRLENEAREEKANAENPVPSEAERPKDS